MVDNGKTRRWPLRIWPWTSVGRSVLVHRLLGVLLFKFVGGGAVKTARGLRQLGLRVYGGGSAMVQQGGTLGVGGAACNIVSGILRHRMHVALTLIYV